VVGKLRALGAVVLQVGETWAHADKYLREEVLVRDANGVYVPPFDHQDLWDGASLIVDELEEQMEGAGGYDAVVCSVGGGGLMCGIVEGLERLGKAEVKVVATETDGAASLARSLEEGKHVTLPGITSIATSLGAVRVADRTYELGKKDMVRSAVFTDAEAAISCVWFADDERILVEAGCGVNVAACYTGRLREVLGNGMSDAEWSRMRAVIVVCGGSNVTLEILEDWREKYGGMVRRPDLAWIGGGEVKQLKKGEAVSNGTEIKI
jgi:L-serine/L-threonine ammonia-lyase